MVLLAAPTAAQSGAITGRVTDARTNTALPGVVVQAYTQGGRVVTDGISNTEGRFLLTGLAAGSYDVSAILIGFAPFKREGVSVTAGGTATLDLALAQQAIGLGQVIVTGSKKVERALEAPAHVEVIDEREIAARPTLTPVDHLRGTPGVDVITQGILSTNVVVRGFNNIFSGALYTLTDHRLASVPSLRVNVMHFVPTTSEDLSRMEVVLGPGAALYGPNTADGVLHLMTKSPLLEPGSTVAFTGGNQDVLQGTVRTGHRLSDNVGFKVSAQLLQAEEFSFVDPDEAAERQRFDGAGGAAARAAYRRDLGLTEAEANARIANIGMRDNDVSRYSGEARLDWRASDELSTTFQTGLTNVGNGVELTGLGAAQVKDWRYGYYQARADWNRLFGQVYLNTSNAGDTYLLRTGQPIVDESTLLVAQLQHGMNVGIFDLVYGADYFYTNPQTRGTINGIYEDEDETTEVGGYLQAETALTGNLNLVLAGRLDDHSALPDPIFSPRAGLV
ncbi:MAG: TonB-dependent receptor, partial [Gemmatimonadota bacterium]